MHIFYRYIYSDAKSIPIKGGTVSEGIVGDVSHLNPLISTNDYNKYIISILYRSLLKYDIKDKKLISDLANCDISNLSYIECFLENNVYWSDKSPITINDVVATYNILKTTNVNPLMKSLLSDTTIEEKSDSIVFKNNKKNINFLNIFFQPIISEKLINELGVEELNKPFSPSKDSLYSGKYKVASIKEDKNLGVVELVLDKNENYFNNDVYLGKLSFKFFPNNNSLVKNKDLINIFNDDENLLGESVPRLESHYYSLPKYTTLFINSEKISSKSLRNFILNKIDRDKLIKVLGNEKYKQVINPYLTDYVIDKDLENKNIESTMEGLGYYKKAKLAKLILGEATTKTPTTVANTTEIKKTPTTEELEKQENKPLLYIISGLGKKFSFISQDDVLLKGDLKGEKPDAVYINDYQLKAYDKGDENFFYRLKEFDYETIKEGKNDYKIYFETNGKKELKEELIVFFYKDINKLSQEKENFYKTFIKTEVAKTPETNTGKESNINQTLKAKIDSIDDRYYYNKKIEKYTLKLMYIGGENNIEQTANFIKEILGDNGIGLEIEAINLSDLSKFVSQENSSQTYDMVLAGINLGYFDFNIYPYFHSSQAKLGYNFSNIKKLALDLILEDINSNKIYQDGFKEKEKKVLDIIKGEQVIKTLYTPIIDLLIDKNIKNINIDKYSSGQINRVNYLSTIYINEKKDINYTNKGVGDFFKFLFHIITG
ncbi:MAG: ABC transporter substrate-binding protein [Candidatus Gracilibacteria bacterium]|nr:ABC transporter substrate-binding protein [Candidatus Gracilibacteria bacterium]